ncbi:hypothetical protein GCM10007933_17760 [Zoogloea oryzae]|uniref:Antitoxin n=2 Tax=Zoogloea oryzae TaxID=310767 RepID=A0ABQ6FCF5_9RHOO|nr:hypothetical protein GCM10007933_17760 [Zoogloea oryzae]
MGAGVCFQPIIWWLTDSVSIPAMKTVPVGKAKAQFSKLLVEVELGEEVTIIRRGLPVVRIVAAVESPVAALTQQAQVAGVFARLREMRQGRTLGGSLREAIEGGRD